MKALAKIPPVVRIRDLPSGELGLYLFAFSMYSSRLLAVLACFLMLGDMLRERSRVMSALRGFALYRWLLVLAIYVLLRGILAMVADPAAAEAQLKDAARMTYLVGVLLIAWQLKGREQLLLRVLLLSALGFFLARFVHLAWSLRAPEAWWEQRHGFGLEAIPLGFYASTVLLGLLVFLPRLYALIRGRSREAVVMGLWCALIGVSLLFVVLSQSRAAWLALLPSLLLLLGLALLQMRVSPASLKIKLLLTPLLLVAVLGTFWLGALTLQGRFAEEPGNIDSLLNLDLAALQSGDEVGQNYSIGTRMNMLRAGWTQWRRQPIFGAGPAGAKQALAASPDPVLRRWNDYHNAIINLLVCYGLLGLLLVLGGVLETLRLGWWAVQRQAYSRDTLLFLGLAFAVLLFSQLSNFRILNFDWRYTLFLLAGALASPALAQVTTRAGEPSPDRLVPGRE
jgi:O-antigen ligase